MPALWDRTTEAVRRKSTTNDVGRISNPSVTAGRIENPSYGSIISCRRPDLGQPVTLAEPGRRHGSRGHATVRSIPSHRRLFA